MDKDTISALADDIYQITKPMFEAVAAQGGLLPPSITRLPLIEELIGYIFEDGGRTESGRIAFEKDDDSPDIEVYFKVGTIRGAPSFEA